jgi:hypothetical protein
MVHVLLEPAVSFRNPILKLFPVPALSLIRYERCYVCPCHHDMALLWVADGGDGLQVWSVAVNILNKQSQTVDKGWSSSLEVGRGTNNSSP